MKDFLIRWEEATMVKDCSMEMEIQFLFENVVIRFRYPNILMNDQGMHFLNKTVEELTEEIQIYHQKRTPYHPWVNGTI